MLHSYTTNENALYVGVFGFLLKMCNLLHFGINFYFLTVFVCFSMQELFNVVQFITSLRSAGSFILPLDKICTCKHLIKFG